MYWFNIYISIFAYFFSTFGEFTDVNIWSRVLNSEEVTAWENFDKVATPDLVNWSNATLNITNLIEENIAADDIKYVFLEFLLNVINCVLKGKTENRDMTTKLYHLKY